MDAEPLKRLTMQGLSVASAIQIVQGHLSETFEMDRLMERKLAAEWCRLKSNRLIRPHPRWDVDPGNFYLAGDGLKANEFGQAEYSVLYADTKEILENLLGREWIEADPWSKSYRSKTAMIAFRWCHDLPVTPPLLAIHEAKLVVDGGNHRLRYSNSLKVVRIPFLVALDQVLQVRAILHSASEFG